jgi:hypothetical protein
MRAANLALRFLLELAALAGLADWGLHTGGWRSRRAPSSRRPCSAPARPGLPPPGT